VFQSEAVTRGIRIRVESRYLADRSSPEESDWFFAYTVNITNEGSIPAQLVSRHWIITDGDGEEREVRGPGVVGEQPLLEPGESFEYTSGCPLPTRVGSMRGSYRMVSEGGESFQATIAPFSLGEPNSIH